MLEKHGLLQSSFQLMNDDQLLGDGAIGVPSCLYGDNSTNEDNISQVSLSVPSKNKTAQEKPNNAAAKGLVAT